MIGKSFFRLLPAVLAVVLAGCHSVAFYRERAVRNARDFLLENAPELTPEQVAFVRYNRPVLLTGEGIGSNIPYTFSGRVTSSQRQICVTWLIPGRSEAYLVYGVSAPEMTNWEPLQLIRKVFLPIDQAWENAVRQARTYAANNLYFQLPVADYNWIRFSNPRIVESSFELALNPEGRLTPQAIEALQRSRRQCSLIWQSPSAPGEYWVFSGLCSPERFADWRLNTAEKRSADEVRARTGKQLYEGTPYHPEEN